MLSATNFFGDLIQGFGGSEQLFSSRFDLDWGREGILVGYGPREPESFDRAYAQGKCRRLANRSVSLFRSIYEFPKPTIAAVNGAAIAGGTGLALLCDFTLAVPEAKFGYTEVRIGLLPAIVPDFFAAAGGRENCHAICCLLDASYDPGEALKMGLVNEIVPAEKLLNRYRGNWRRNWRRIVHFHFSTPSNCSRRMLAPNSDRATARLKRPSAKMPVFARAPISARESHRFWKSANRSGRCDESGPYIDGCECQSKGDGEQNRIRVRYAETDQMGVVYHANHFIWFEVGRVELLRQLGFSYKDMERKDDCFIAVVDACCRYKAPVHYDDEVVSAHLSEACPRESDSLWV